PDPQGDEQASIHRRRRGVERGQSLERQRDRQGGGGKPDPGDRRGGNRLLASQLLEERQRPHGRHQARGEQDGRQAEEGRRARVVGDEGADRQERDPERRPPQPDREGSDAGQGGLAGGEQQQQEPDLGLQ